MQRPVEDAEVHQSDISALMPEPKCSAEASEESDEMVAVIDANNSPAIAQGSSSVEPITGELVGDPADVAPSLAITPFYPQLLQITPIGTRSPFFTLLYPSLPFLPLFNLVYTKMHLNTLFTQFV